MTVNEAIEKLTELQKIGYGELDIESNEKRINERYTIFIPKDFMKPTNNYNYVVTMFLEEETIH